MVNKNPQNGRSVLFMKDRSAAEKKARELVSRMTLEEKASQLLHKSPAIPRLGIPELFPILLQLI